MSLNRSGNGMAVALGFLGSHVLPPFSFALNGKAGTVIDQPHVLHFRQSISTPGPPADSVTALLSPGKSGIPVSVWAIAFPACMWPPHFLQKRSWSSGVPAISFSGDALQLDAFCFRNIRLSRFCRHTTEPMFRLLVQSQLVAIAFHACSTSSSKHRVNDLNRPMALSTLRLLV